MRDSSLKSIISAPPPSEMLVVTKAIFTGWRGVLRPVSGVIGVPAGFAQPAI
jgi:hypothetical protein